MRPTQLHIGGTLRWVLNTYNPDTMLLKDADATPTITVRKNGSSTGDSVTITKRSATTGIYDCEYNPAAEVEGDQYTIRESAQVTGTTTAQQTYEFSWPFTVIALERGTENALTTLGTNAPANWLNAAAFADGAFDAVWAVTERTLSAFSFEVTLTSAYDAAKTAAQPEDVSPTIDFNPTITVNPTVLSTESVDAIRLGLALTTDVTSSTSTLETAISNITVELSPENIEEISDAVSAAVGEGLVEEIEREEGLLNTLNNSFNTVFTGIRYLAEWIRK